MRIPKKLKKFLGVRVSGTFTIEAAFIIPAALVITVFFLNISIRAHLQDVTYTEKLAGIIETAADAAGSGTQDVEEGGDGEDSGADYFDARAMLLRYKLIRDGASILNGELTGND